jgi:hypothetical protein
MASDEAGTTRYQDCIFHEIHLLNMFQYRVGMIINAQVYPATMAARLWNGLMTPGQIVAALIYWIYGILL